MIDAASLERVMATLRPALTEGRTADEAEWAVDGYEQFVVRPRLDVHLDDTAAAAAWAARVAAELSGPLVALESAQRWAFIVEAVYAGRVAQVSNHAFALAQRVAQSGDQTLFRSAAAEIMATLSTIDAELAEHAPSVRARLTHEIGEAMLDCRYVASGGDRTATSRRLGAYLA